MNNVSVILRINSTFWKIQLEASQLNRGPVHQSEVRWRSKERTRDQFRGGLSKLASSRTSCPTRSCRTERSTPHILEWARYTSKVESTIARAKPSEIPKHKLYDDYIDYSFNKERNKYNHTSIIMHLSSGSRLSLPPCPRDFQRSSLQTSDSSLCSLLSTRNWSVAAVSRSSNSRHLYYNYSTASKSWHLLPC